MTDESVVPEVKIEFNSDNPNLLQFFVDKSLVFVFDLTPHKEKLQVRYNWLGEIEDVEEGYLALLAQTLLSSDYDGLEKWEVINLLAIITTVRTYATQQTFVESDDKLATLLVNRFAGVIARLYDLHELKLKILEKACQMKINLDDFPPEKPVEDVDLSFLS